MRTRSRLVSTSPRRGSLPMRVTRLQDRLAPAVATWDGGGANANWTTVANWVGDVAPQPGDDLVFPDGAARLANVNDFPVGTSFGHVDLNGFNYQITGNGIVLSKGIGADTGGPGAGNFADVPPNIALNIDFNTPQALTGGSGFTLTGNIGLSLNFTGQLTVANSATVRISGSIQGAGGLTKFVGGALFLTGNNTYSGPTLIERGGVFFNGTQTEPIMATGGLASGAGTVAELTAANGGEIKPDDGAPSIIPSGHRLTTGDLTVRAAGPGSIRGFIRPAGVLTILIRSFAADTPTAHDQLVVQGFVQLGGALRLRTVSFSRGGPLGDGTITIIDNDGTDAVQGTFAGLPEGAVINNINEKAARISYKGGDGNDVTLTTVDPRTVPRFAVGAGPGGVPLVKVYAVGNDTFPPETSAVPLREFYAYDPAFRGGVRVATGDFTGDGVIDVVTAPGPGGGPHVRVWNGATGALVREFMAYAAFSGGVYVAAADVSGDGTPDIITGAGAGGGPHVQVFDGKSGAQRASFLAYDPAFRGGVTVAGVDLYGQDRAFVVTGAGPGGGPHVKIFNATGPVPELQSFFAFDPSFRGGITVAAGDTNGDGVPDIIVGAGASGSPQVRIFSGLNLEVLRDYAAYNPAFTGGVTVTAVTLSFRGATVVTGAGPGGGPHVTDLGSINFMAFDPAFRGGVFVG